MLSGENICVTKRHYKVIILNGSDPIDYCFSNTLSGVLDYVNFSFVRNFNKSHSLELNFKIIRYEFGDTKTDLAEDLPTA